MQWTLRASLCGMTSGSITAAPLKAHNEIGSQLGHRNFFL
jgi:hypothetical protein